MPSRDDGRIVLWPRYFDARLSRAEGRRVPAERAVQRPDAKWVESAAKKEGFSVDLDEKARHPARPFEKCGCVLVSGDVGKEAVIQRVAARMHASQSEA